MRLDRRASARRTPGGRALDALNFCLADVQGGLGPYLAVYLLTERHWNDAAIGIVMSIAGMAGLLASTPVGALIDASRRKRLLITVCAGAVTVGALLLYVAASFWAVAIVQAGIGVCGAVFGPAIAAISLGIVGHAGLASRNGRNQAFNHAGNAAAAAVAGGLAAVWGPVAVFLIIAVLGPASITSVALIPAAAINDNRARGLRDGGTRQNAPSGLQSLIHNRPLLLFALCVALFHLANAAMLPLVGQKLALQNRNQGTALMSACILGAQLVMVPMAILVGRRADRWGRKPLFLAGFLVLPLRGCLYTLSDDPFWLVGVQLLDGIGAGLFGALAPLIVADLTEGSGRFNVSQGAIATAQGIGASLSIAMAGEIVDAAGFSAAFLSLAAIATTGALLFALGMPESYRASGPAAEQQSGAPPAGLA